MNYLVKYRKCGAFFWRKIKKVKGDASLMREDGLAMRVFVLEDETRIEIPALSHEFFFSKDRFLVVTKNMEAAAGQKLTVAK
jgi:hypothetical protein